MRARSRSWRRLTVGLMVPPIAVLTLQIRYYAPHHLEDINIAAPSSAEPLAITTSPPPVTIAPPQLSAERPVGAHSLFAINGSPPAPAFAGACSAHRRDLAPRSLHLGITDAAAAV